MPVQGPAAGSPHLSRLRRASFSQRAKAYSGREIPALAGPRHPPAGPVCLVFWADRGPGASCPYGEGPRRALVTFPRWKVTRGFGGAAPQSYLQAVLGSRCRSAFQLYHIAGQSAGHVRKNPQFQPHILFSSRRKENVPLTVQEKRAAGGAVPLWRTPPDPLLTAPRTDAVLLCISLREKVGPHSDGGWDQR